MGPVHCLKPSSREICATVQAPEMKETGFGGSSITGAQRGGYTASDAAWRCYGITSPVLHHVRQANTSDDHPVPATTPTPTECSLN